MVKVENGFGYCRFSKGKCEFYDPTSEYCKNNGTAPSGLQCGKFKSLEQKEDHFERMFPISLEA